MVKVGTDVAVVETGGQIDALVMALIEAAYDKEDSARDAMRKSLLSIGRKQPALILSSCEVFLTKHKKLVMGHRIVLLSVMTDVVELTLDELVPELALRLTQLAVKEMTTKQEIVPEWQSAASAVVVAIGKKYGRIVLDELTGRFTAGVVPHYYVIKTLGDFASANVFAVVPAIEDIISRCLPMLGMVKHDNMRWVFTITLSKFCEAILTYIANIERAEDKTVTVSRYSQQIYSAFEILFNVWLNSREAKLRLAVVEALGVMSYILTLEKLAGVMPKLIPNVTGLYKKSKDLLPITQGLMMILDAGVKDGGEMLSPHLDFLLGALYPLLQYLPNYDDPPTVKNYNELLRCFEKLCKVFSDRLLSFLFLKLELKDERSRAGTLNVIKHLVNTSSDHLDDKRELVVTGLRPLLVDPSTLVRQSLAQLIIAMAHHGYLSLEGGHILVQYLIDQCSTTDMSIPKGKEKDADYVTPKQLRAMCENIIHLATTTISGMEFVFWPYLLEFVIPIQYTPAIPTVCKSLATLATKLSEDDRDEFDIDYTVEVNLPRPPALFARLMVLIGHPLEFDRGLHCLNLLQAISLNLHEELVDLFDEVAPKLIGYMEANKEDWKQSVWEDLLLKLLSRSLDSINDEEWTMELGIQLGQHYELYPDTSEMRNVVSKCLGVVLCKSTKKAFIDEHLDIMFRSVSHTSQIEREGCARGFGFAASAHLDQVIEKLKTLAKSEMVRKSSGFLGMMKDKTEADVSRIKSTVMLCYGYVTLYAPPSLITSRVEVNILATINPHFSNVRDVMVKENLIRCVDLIGKALHPSHLKSEKFNFHRRGDLIAHMLSYLQMEPMSGLTTETRALTIDALTTLLKLDPKLSEADLFQLLSVVTACVFDLPEVAKDDSERTLLMDRLLESVNNLLGVIIEKDANIACVHSLLQHLTKWMTSTKPHQRIWMIKCYFSLLSDFEKCAVQLCKEGEDQGELDKLGTLVAQLVPRCTDPELDVREHALGCMQMILRVKLAYAGSLEKDIMVEAITKLRERTQQPEPNAQFSVVNDLSKVLAKKINEGKLLDFLYPLLEGLLDREPDSASGACVVLNGMFRLRGVELAEEIDDMVEALHLKMTCINHDRTITGILRGLRTLSVHHLIPVMTKLLSYEVPYDKYIVEAWHTLAMDENLAPQILHELLNILNTTRPWEDNDRKSAKLAASPPMKATCAVRELFAVEETQGLANDEYAAVMSTLIVRVGSCSGIEKCPTSSQPIDDAIDAFKEFLTRSDSQYMFDALDDPDVWYTFRSESTYTEGFTAIAAAICEHRPDQVADIVKLLEPALKKVYDSQRVVAAATYAEFIFQRCGGDLSLIEHLKMRLLSTLVDKSHVVRMLCIRGLGNVASIPDEQMKKHSTTVLSAMMAGFDDRDDPEDQITLEAMKGLSKILPKLEEDNVRSILINIALRIRPCFEKEKPGVRSAAIRLFGDLSRFGDGPSKVPFMEQIHANLVSLLLHVNDADPDVVVACKTALRQLAPLMDSEPMNKMLQHLRDDGALHYIEFTTDLSKVLIQDFPDKINFYTMNCVGFFRSDWTEIKANAAIFCGCILGSLPVDQHKLITKEHVCGELIRLLKDPAVDVRRHAAEAMSLLHQY